MHFICRERAKKEKTQTIDHLRQSNYYLSTLATPYERGHDYSSNEMAND
jgi:hypothetical protein